MAKHVSFFLTLVTTGLIIGLIMATVHSSRPTEPVYTQTPDPVTDYRDYWTAPEGSMKKKHIFFTGIPMPGHMFPLLATAEELAKRGYTVTVSTVQHLDRVIKNHVHPLVNHYTIGQCQTAVDEWQRLQLTMNDVVDFAETSAMVFNWIQVFHPCHYSHLHSVLSRSQLKMDFDPANPDYSILPPVDFVISDLVTQSMHDLARTLSIRFLINNPDILQVLPGNTVGNWNNIPMMFIEDSIHPFNYGIEVRKYSQQFHKGNNPNAPSTLTNTNFTEILTNIDTLDPDTIPTKMIESIREPSNKSTIMNTSTFTTMFHNWYGFGTRIIYGLARPLVEMYLFYTNDVKTAQHRHAQGEMTIYHHLQLYIQTPQE